MELITDFVLDVGVGLVLQEFDGTLFLASVSGAVQRCVAQQVRAIYVRGFLHV